MLGQANKFQDLACRQYLNNNNNKIEEDIKVINISKIVKKKNLAYFIFNRFVFNSYM